MRRWFPLLAAVLIGAGPVAAAAEVSEVQLKAAFLFHFTQFVDWPEAQFSSPDAPFVIGVFGDNQIEAALGVSDGAVASGVPTNPVDLRPSDP